MHKEFILPPRHARPHLKVVRGQALLTPDQLHSRVRNRQVLKINLMKIEFEYQSNLKCLNYLLVHARNRVNPAEVG